MRAGPAQPALPLLTPPKVCSICGAPPVVYFQRKTAPGGWRYYCLAHHHTDPDCCRNSPDCCHAVARITNPTKEHT